MPLGILTTQQENFLAYYLDPTSPTFENALQSALRAEYRQEYAESITAKMPDWLAEAIAERVGDSKRMRLVDKHFDEVLTMETAPNGHKDAQLVRAKSDVAKFVGETMGKIKYGKRAEVEINLNSLPSLIQIVAPVRPQDPIKDITGTIKDVDGLVEPLK